MTLNDQPIQSLIWPEDEICGQQELYARLSGGAVMFPKTREIRFDAGGGARFDTAMNLFNLGTWQSHCSLEDLWVELEGQGGFEASLWYLCGTKAPARLIREELELYPNQPHKLSRLGAEIQKDAGVLVLELQSSGPGVLRQVDWKTSQKARRTPDLMLSITTYRREDVVLSTIKRFEQFAATSLVADRMHLTVVDNGRTLSVENRRKVTFLPNANYGGSGGFARGLMAARERGASHCLFMDDDASVHFQVLERTLMFLAHVTDHHTAVSGALTNAERPWEIWENGACFNVFCRPAFKDTDLRQTAEVLEMEIASTADKPENFYGGWWYFAFPLDQTQYMPFPFFVRGDDISFSLMNPFRIVPLTGAICFQSEDFSAKESPRTAYLDFRSHFAHHFYAPQLMRPSRLAFKVPVFFFLRFFLSCHYEALAAVNLSFHDSLTGPETFRQNLDMQDKFGEIGRLVENEVWQSRPAEKPVERIRFNPDRLLDRLLMKFTLNGHLLPFFSKLGNHIILPSQLRGHRREIWGAARITYISADETQTYTVTHNKRRAFRQAWQFTILMCALTWRYRGLRKQWCNAYLEMTTQEFWQKSL